jgi:N-acetylneuraminic acid mutarotase
MAALLPDGRVLVTGGLDGNNKCAPTAELYDPRTGRWSYTSAMNGAHYLGTSTLLSNGKVLIAGGIAVGDNGVGLPCTMAEVYDPMADSWTVAGAFGTGRCHHAAVLMGNGMVLVAGGFNADSDVLLSTELFDPSTGTWTEARDMCTPRAGGVLIRLQNAKALIAGGMSTTHTPSSSVELLILTRAA